MSGTDATAALAEHPLFKDVPLAAIEELRRLARPRRVGAGEALCEAGDAGTSLLVIVRGVAHVHVGDACGPAARLRRGDVVGEMSLLTGERRSATVVAVLPVSLLELDRDAFTQLLADHPVVLNNLTRILSERLRATTARAAARPSRGEVVALVAGAAGAVLPDLVEAAGAATPRRTEVIDARESVEDALAAVDGAVAEDALVLLLGSVEQEAFPALVAAADRTFAFATSEQEARRLRGLHARGSRRAELELVLLDQHAQLDQVDVLRLGRRIAGTRLGLALGAGGARGYAHVGVLAVLEDAGHVVDCVAGSSIGAIVGTWLGLGLRAAEVEAAMRATFTPETVEAMFRRSFTGAPAGLATLERAFRECTHDATFDDLQLPLAVLAVDLESRRPVVLREGPLWQALLAATALAGVFPPVARGGRRLVDALALEPVPTDAVRDLGADVALSVNLIPRQTLPAWPGCEVQPQPQLPSGSRTLDALLEVLDLGQLEASERQAARADVAVTPLFGPSTWRDFHLAEMFLNAGHDAAEDVLPLLAQLVSPQLASSRVLT
jgi:predicted acylesterase/phospholipase RssA/CRP-like cAMP-binding protein